MNTPCGHPEQLPRQRQQIPEQLEQLPNRHEQLSEQPEQPPDQPEQGVGRSAESAGLTLRVGQRSTSFQFVQKACGSEQRDDRKDCGIRDFSGSWRCSPHADAVSARYGMNKVVQNIDVMGLDVKVVVPLMIF